MTTGLESHPRLQRQPAPAEQISPAERHERHRRWLVLMALRVLIWVFAALVLLASSLALLWSQAG